MGVPKLVGTHPPREVCSAVGMSRVEMDELGVYRSEVAEFDHGGSNRKCEFEVCELFPRMFSRIFFYLGKWA